MHAAAVENGQHSAGLLVSRRDWAEAAALAEQARGVDEEALSAMASSAPDAAAVRANGLLSGMDGGGSPEGGSPVHGGPRQSEMFNDLPRDD